MLFTSDKNLFVRLIKHDLINGKSPIIVTVGERGCGKTCLAITLAEIFYPGFEYNKHHCYTLKEYLMAVKNTCPGGVINYEEAGTSLDKARHYSPVNRIFSEANQIDRYKNFLTNIILPDVSLLATQHTKMLKYMLWVTRIGSFTFYRNFRVPIDYTSKFRRTIRIRTYINTPLPSLKNYAQFLTRDRSEKEKIREELIREATVLQSETEVKMKLREEEAEALQNY
jgi:hypothetical protein